MNSLPLYGFVKDHLIILQNWIIFDHPIADLQMWKKPQAAYIKIVVIGRSGVGKTSMIKTFQHLQYSTSGGIPSDETDRRYPCQIDGNEISFLIQDSVVGEKDQRIRALSYKDADVFLLLFDISNCEGKSIIPKWWVELKHFCPNVPVIAVASKVDLRDDLAIRTLTRVRCAALAQSIGALEYIEVHSFDELSVQKAFQEACKAGFQFHTSKSQNREKLCFVL